MSKTPSEKLHRLVRSLSSAEKRYFRLYLKGRPGVDTKYAQLFEAMAGTASFDDDAWKAIIYKSQDVGGKKYTELKSYLYELVLKALHSFDERHSAQHRVSQWMQSVGALFKRGHYADCRDMLTKAKKVAKQYELFAQLADIARWEKQLAYTQMDVDFLHKHMDRLLDEEARALEQLQNAAVYRKAFFQAYVTIKKDPLQRGPERLETLRELVGRPEFSDPGAALSHTARVLRLRTLSLYYHTALEQEQFYETGRTLIALQESQPHFLKENLSDYIAALSNQTIACGLLQKYGEVRECLEKMRSIRPLTTDDRRKIHRQYYSSFFALCIYTGEFEEGRREMERCLADAAEFDPKEYETGSFYLLFVPICIGCKDYGSALDHLNHWLAQKRTVGREDLQSLARILSLLLHFELGNYLLLDSQLRSAARFMKKKNRLHQLERQFMSAIGEAIRHPELARQRLAFEKVKVWMEGRAGQPETKALLQTFDLLTWLDAKARGRDFAELVNEKFWLSLRSSQHA